MLPTSADVTDADYVASSSRCRRCSAMRSPWEIPESNGADGDSSGYCCLRRAPTLRLTPGLDLQREKDHNSKWRWVVSKRQTHDVNVYQYCKAGSGRKIVCVCAIETVGNKRN